LVIDVNYSDRYYHKGVGIFVILYEWICVYVVNPTTMQSRPQRPR
jgi:hypothetical protein